MSEAMQEYPLLDASKNLSKFLSLVNQQPDTIGAEIDALVARFNTGIILLDNNQRELGLLTESKRQLFENKQLISERRQQVEKENDDLRERIASLESSQVKHSPSNDVIMCENESTKVGNQQVPASQVSTLRSPPHPDPGPFTGEKCELLPAFLKQLQLKLAQNDD
ncbi:hypothetical protein K3495_g5536 [Podosphaera aphanis]|nr:hypothetical protein K3495_g5536 [Podosphaera aphanis]